MIIVLDTNVLVAAFLTAGVSREVLKEVRDRRMLYLSPYILEEFRSVLESKKFGFPKELVGRFVHFLEKDAVIQAETEKISIGQIDPDDRPILELCETLRADCLVTGDHELLLLKKLGRTRIISPSSFLKEVGT